MTWNFFHKIATRLMRQYQSLLGISTLGARAIVLNSQNQILLVKHTYQPHWYLPGGGVNKGESFKTALLRELKEEVGVTTRDEPELFGVYFHTYQGVHDYPIIYVIKNFTMGMASSPEIEQMGWFDYSNLPDMVSPGTKRRLTEYFNHSPPAESW